jgi:hypothetical protein
MRLRDRRTARILAAQAKLEESKVEVKPEDGGNKVRDVSNKKSTKKASKTDKDTL